MYQDRTIVSPTTPQKYLPIFNQDGEVDFDKTDDYQIKHKGKLCLFVLAVLSSLSLIHQHLSKVPLSNHYLEYKQHENASQNNSFVLPIDSEVFSLERVPDSNEMSNLDEQSPKNTKNIDSDHLRIGKYNYVQAQNENQELRFAWLMSYPNSGTTFTMKTVTAISKTTMASNYGKEHLDLLGNTILFGSSYKKGPFRNHIEYPIPKGYILTKTHCGGRCTNCRPSLYIETEWSFQQRCLEGSRLTNIGNETVTETDTYDPLFIKKSIHLMRNPFDNIVSRFHLAWNHESKAANSKWLEANPRSAKGFQNWCRDLDGMFESEEKQSFYKDIPYLDQIPCHAEFFRYTQWHNRAFQVTEKMDIPTLIIHYEDYDDDINQTISRIASFLEIDIVSSPPEYHRSDYNNYFSAEQREYALRMVNAFATRTTWKELMNAYNYV